MPINADQSIAEPIKLPFVIKIVDLSIFERPFYTGFTVSILTFVWGKIVINFLHIHLNMCSH